MIRVFTILLLLAGLAAPVPAAAGDGKTLLDRCFTPEALAGTAAEIKPQPNHGKLDVTALRQEPVPAATPIPESLRGSIRGVELPPGEKLIALTFDLCETDGSTAGYDGRIVDLLRAQGVKATFFAGGKWMETHPERIAQLIADPNFEVGSHGLRHLDLSRLNGEKLNDEIALTESAYARARRSLTARQCAAPVDGDKPLPERMTLLRFPYGTCDPVSLAAVADQGLYAIQWDLVTGDPDPHRSAKAIAETIVSKAHPGAIIVAHANGRGWHTADALAIAIPKLKEAGYGFVTVSELLAAGKPVIAAKCYLNQPGSGPRLARAHRRKSQDVFSLFGPRN
jgi:peptidoglycan/xylan/chitin deacetylase (PgdA/CDA1 family)